MEENTNINADQGKTYTQAEVDEIIQREGDKRVTAALKKREATLTEAAKLAAMNETERAAYELKQREDAIAARELAVSQNEQKFEAIRILNESGLDIRLADYCIGATADETNAKIKILTQIVNDAVSKGIKEKIGGTPAAATGSQVGVSKKDFAKMSIAEQAKLARENKELYNSLTM